MPKFFKCVVIWILVLGLCACQMQGAPEPPAYMDALDNYYQALSSNNFAVLRQAMPAQVLDSLGLDAGELANLAHRYAQEYGDGYTVKVSENGSVRFDKTQLADLDEYLQRQYSIGGDLQDGYLVEYQADFSGSNGGKCITGGMVVYQLDGDWYIDLQADATVASIRQLYDN